MPLTPSFGKLPALNLETQNRFDSLWFFCLGCQITVFVGSWFTIALILKYYKLAFDYKKKESILLASQPANGKHLFFCQAVPYIHCCRFV